MQIVTIDETRHSTDVQARLREVMLDLAYPTYEAAAAAVPGMGAAQMHHACHKNPPGAVVLNRIATGWKVPAAVFFLTQSESAPLLDSAPKYVAPIKSVRKSKARAKE